MEKLELKHLAAYLPYGLKGVYNENKESDIVDITGLCLFNKINHLQIRFKDNTSGLFDCEIKPILRPLSDLVNVITHKGKDFVPCIEYNHFNEYFEELSKLDYSYVKYNQNRVVLILLELHFDIFGLIEKNLAVDINTI